MSSEEPPTPVAPMFETVSILRLIKDAQQKHGLRQGNYLRYRGYCARRVRRIRKSLKFTHSYKCFPKRPAKFGVRPVTVESITESRFLEVVIFDIERNWAYAMQLKLEIGDELRSRKKFHMRQKLRKAAKYSRHLEHLTKSCDQVNTTTKFEAQAYSAFIRGALYVEFKMWRKALEVYKTVKKIYEKLSAFVKDQELVDLYTSRCREVQNTLRLCEYNCSEEAPSKEVQKLNLNDAEEELDLDFNKLANEFEKEKQSESKPAAEDSTKELLKQLHEDWRKVDISKLKSLKTSVSSLPPLQPMPCKPMFFDLAINYLKKPLTSDQIEGKKKQKKAKNPNPAPVPKAKKKKI